MLSRLPQTEFLSPDDLSLCQRVFDKLCTEAGFDGTGIESQILASTVLSTFQRGIIKEADLLSEVRARRDDFMKLTGRE